MRVWIGKFWQHIVGAGSRQLATLSRQGQPDLVEATWEQVDDPLRCCLVGSELCRRLRRKLMASNRAKAFMKRRLKELKELLDECLVGVLDQISKPQVARKILYEVTSLLGLPKRVSECNLLRLALRVRSRELITHDVAQGVLDEVWRGRDPDCGKLMLRLDKVRYMELLRCMLLSLFGWTSLGGLFIPIAKNDMYERARAKRKHPYPKRKMLGRVCERFELAVHLYRIPAVKYNLLLLEVVTRGALLVPVTNADPRAPFSAIDYVFMAFILSALLQELQELRFAGLYDYVELFTNVEDLCCLILATLFLSMRVAASTMLKPPVLQVAYILQEQQWDQRGDALLIASKLLAAALAISQMLVITRVISQASDVVGPFVQSLRMIVYDARRILIPYILIQITFGIVFEVFDTPQGWTWPWYRFASMEDTSLFAEQRPQLVTLWFYVLCVDIMMVNLLIAMVRPAQRYHVGGAPPSPCMHPWHGVRGMAQALTRPWVVCLADD